MYPNNDNLLISVQDIKGFGVLDSNVAEHQLLPIVKHIQDEVVHNLIGTCLYEKLLDLIATEEIRTAENEKYKELLDGYIFHIMAWKVKAESCVDMSYKVRNIGTATISDDRAYPASFSDTQKISAYFHNRADKYVIELGKFLSCNCRCFPELRCCENWWDKKPNPTSGRHSSIYFPKRR